MLMNFYLEHLSNSDSDAEYERAAKQFVTFLNRNDIEIENLMSADILKYVRHLDKKYAATTAKTKFYQAKSFIIFLYENELVEKHPDRIFTRSTVKELPNIKPKKKKIFSIDGLLRVCRSAKNKYRAPLFFLLNTGARISTLEQVKVDEVDFRNEILKVYEKKNNSYRELPMSKEVKSELLDYYEIHRPEPKPDHQNFFFLSQRGTQFRIRSLQDYLPKHSRNVIGEKVVAKNFRDFFATSLAINKESEQSIKEMGGWKSGSSIQAYTRVDAESARDILNRSHGLFINEERKRERKELEESKNELFTELEKVRDIYDRLKKAKDKEKN
jgi:integrase/recombinase XerD